MKPAHGFTLVTAIFVLMVVGLLGAYMVRFTGVQLDTTNYALQGARAYQAARSGIEWSIARIINGGSCTDVNAQTAMTFTGIIGFTVTLSCTSQAYTEANLTPTIYTLTALSQYDAYTAGDYSARQLSVSIVH
jgi:MSHA biogenesis protein MshP